MFNVQMVVFVLFSSLLFVVEKFLNRNGLRKNSPLQLCGISGSTMALERMDYEHNFFSIYLIVTRTREEVFDVCSARLVLTFFAGIFQSVQL